MYICEKCGRFWGQDDAEENDYLCTRKCNGSLILKKAAGHQEDNLMDRLPFPVAYPWYMSLNSALPPDKRVNNMIFTAYQAMRMTGLLLLSDYLESSESCLKMGKPLNKMRMPHWQDWMALTDTLAKFMSGEYSPKYPPPKDQVFDRLAQNWRSMGKFWKQEPLAAQFVQGKTIPSPMEIFRNIRNDRAHRLAVMDSTGDESKILETYLPVLEYVVRFLFEKTEIVLLRRPPDTEEEFAQLLEDPLSETFPLLELKGVHEDFRFEGVEYPADEGLREALQGSPLVALSQEKTLPVYPLFLSLDLEVQNSLGQIEPALAPGTELEKVTLADGFTEKKISYLGVKTSVTVEGMGKRLMERLRVKKHELGLSREEAHPWLMVEWARDNAGTTLGNLTMKKYFPQCYVVRPMDMRLLESLHSSDKAVLVSGEAGSGKSSLLCRLVESLLDKTLAQEREKSRQKHFQKKVKGKNLHDNDVLQAFMTLQGAGDVIIFVSGRQGVPVEGNESMERAFARTLLRVCGVRESAFNTPLEFMARLDESVKSKDGSAKKDEEEDRKVWIVLDAINEVERFRDFANYLDVFIKKTAHYPWLRVICSTRSGALNAFQENIKKQNIHGTLPFSEEESFLVFSNVYADGVREEPRLNLPPFTPEEVRQAYKIRQNTMPERSAVNRYDLIPPEVKALLVSPLYLHLFHETWKGREADFSGITGEDTLFEAYLGSLEKELPGMNETLNTIGEYLYEHETPVWDEQAAQEHTRNWMADLQIESAFRVCTLTPVETLVSASLLMRPTDDERGFQFSHQKICEQVLRRKLLKDWKASEKSSTEDVKAIFQSWLEKGERYDWLANAAAGLFAQWVHKPESSYLSLLPELKNDIPTALQTVFRSIFLSMCEKSRFDENDQRFINSGLKLGNQYFLFTEGMSDACNIASNTGRSLPVKEIYEIAVPLQEQLINMEAQHTDFQRELSVSLNNLGEIYKALGEGGKALEYQEKSLQVMQDLVSREPQRTDFQRDLSMNYNNVGSIYQALGEGGKALEYYAQALQVIQDLVSWEPKRTDFQRGLSVSFNKMGRIYEIFGVGGKALEYYKKALQVMLNLVTREPQRTDFQRELSVCFNEEGRTYETLGEGGKALECYKQALQVIQGLVYREPQRTDFQRELSVSFNNMGRVYETLSEGGKALENHKQALQVMQGLVSREPQRMDFQLELSVCFNHVGMTYETLGEGGKALENSKQALQVLQGLVSREPQRTDFQRELSVSFNHVGRIYQAFGEGNKALEYYEKSLQVMQDLVSMEPQRTDFQSDLSMSFNNVGRIYSDLGKGDKALKYYEKSLQISQELVSKEPQRTDFQRDLSVSFNNVGMTYEILGEGGKALEYYKQALQVMQGLVYREPQRTDFQRELSVCFNNVGMIYKTLGEKDKTLKYYVKSLQISQELVSKEPQHTDFLLDLSVSYDNVGGIYQAFGEGDKALKYYGKSLQMMLELVVREPKRTDFQRELSVCYSKVGWIYQAFGEGDKALKYYKKALQMELELVVREPKRTDFKRDLSVSYDNVGGIHEALGEGDKAMGYYEKSLQVKQELVTGEPQRVDFQIGLAISCWRIYLVCSPNDEIQWLTRAKEILLPLRMKGVRGEQLETLWDNVLQELEKRI
jgi:tetratricopeptide (TPR) repeat protein